jgi:translation initiation factor IF-3
VPCCLTFRRNTRTTAIARRRFFRPEQNWTRGPRINEMIRISPIRLIDENSNMIGIVETPQALLRAREVGLDLVEVAPDSSPPVCRILDFGKYKYEQAKKDKANKARSKTAEMKEVRLGRSMKIDPHDVRIRLNQARKFLMEGHKVQIVQNFRGREMMHKHRGDERMQEIIEDLADISKVETPPRLAGRRMTMILTPERAKIEQVKRRSGGSSPAPDDDGEKPESDGAANTPEPEPAEAP